MLLRQVHQLRHWKEEKYANEERNLQVKEELQVALQRFLAVFHVVFASQVAEKEGAEEVEAASFALVAENFWAEAEVRDQCVQATVNGRAKGGQNFRLVFLFQHFLEIFLFVFHHFCFEFSHLQIEHQIL